MRQLINRTGLTLLLFCGALLAPAAAQNSITGIVFDDNRRPVSDLYVELLDEVERLIATRKTRGGFYTFQRLERGIYYLRVRTEGTNFREQKLRIDLGDLNAIGGVDARQQDIYLELDRDAAGTGRNLTGVVFVQEVPDAAREHFERGLDELGRGRDAAAGAAFEAALRVFPDYFDALEQLGGIHLRQKDHAAAEEIFRRAAAVNPKSFSVRFNLAVAQNNLGKRAEAADSLARANELDPGSINAHLLLGIIERRLKRFGAAERSLLRAKELSGDREPDINWQLAELFYFDLKRPAEAADELEAYLRNLTSEEKRNNPDKIEMVRKLIRQIRSEANGPD